MHAFRFWLLVSALLGGPAAEIPEPPPPSPPRRSAHAVLRGGRPPEARGHAVFREMGASIELVLNATDHLPGDKVVSLVPARSCDALEAVSDEARVVGELTIEDDGRGRMTARLGGVSIDPKAPNTLIDVLLVVHADAIEACGRILVGSLRPGEEGAG